MKYKCLVLDHDDTVVNSSQSIHYPAFLHTLKTLRPHLKPLSFQEFNHHCFIYGFNHLCKERYQFSEDEMQIEYKIWKSHTISKQADPFDGWLELLHKFKEHGGRIVVVSYSESNEILRDYTDHFGFSPDLIFAHDHGKDKLKPNPFPIHKLMEDFKLSKNEILVIDDMPVGFEMAKNADVDFIWAQWAYFDESLNQQIIKTSSQSLLNVNALYEILEFDL
jgi:beta-phosphoglucomutase-like phosphatase (HAD superfamily)